VVLKRLPRMCRVGLLTMCAVATLQFPPLLAKELTRPNAGAEHHVLSHRQTHRLVRLAQPKLKDVAGWADDILWSLRFSGLSPNAENVCALIATIDQESNFKANPPVHGLGKRAVSAFQNWLEETDFKAFGLRGIFVVDPSIKRRLFARLLAARTERDIDLAYRKLIGEILSIRFLIQLDTDYGLGAGEFFEAQNEITTIGSMQVSVASALEFERRYLDRPLNLEDIYRVRDFLYTRRGGLLAGTRQLLGYRSGYTRKIYRFADYNAGRYSSRNAAYQWVVSQIDGSELALDGDLLIYRGQKASPVPSKTERVILRISQTHGLGLNATVVRQDLRLEKAFEFTETATFRRIGAFYKATFGLEPPFARVPEIKLESVKLDRPLTTAWFARRVEGRYRRCLSRNNR